MSNNLVQRMQNAVNSANDASRITYNVLTGDVDVPVVVDGVDIPTLSTRIRDFLDLALDGGDLTGDDGVGIETMDITEDGHLMVSLTGDVSPRDLGKIVPEDGVGVEDIKFDPTDGSVEFTLEDQKKIKLNNVAGDDGVSVSSAYVRRGNLHFELSDGSDIDAGDISQFGGVAASDAEINNSGELVLIFTDGTTKTLGQVKGDRGKDGKFTIAGFFDAAGVLRMYRNDGSQYNLGQAVVPILDATGVSIEGVEIVGGELILKLTDGDYNVGQVVGNDGIDGTDGKDIEEIYIDDTDNNLYIRLTGEAAKSVGEVRNTIFENADVAVTSAEIKNKNLHLDVTVNGVVQKLDLGKVVGDDGRIFSDASFEAATGTLTFTDDEGNTLEATGIQQNTIDSAEVDTNTGILTIKLSDGTSVSTTNDIRGNDGVDGTGVTDVKIVSGELVFTFDDPQIGDVNVGNILAPTETDATINQDGELVVIMSDTQEFNLGKIKGVDGTQIENAVIDNGVLKIDIQDGAKGLVVGNVTKNPSSASVTKDDTLKIDFDDNTSIETTETVAAKDGDTITDVKFDKDGRKLTIDLTTDNTNTTSSVTIDAVRGRGIQDFSLDETTRTLSFNSNLPNEGPYSYTFPKPVSGETVERVEVVGENLEIDTSLNGGETLSVPVHDGLSLDTITKDENDDLVITLSDDSTHTLKTISGRIGDGIDSVTFDEETEDLNIKLNDSQTITVPKVRGIDGEGITAISYDSMASELHITNTLDAEPLVFPVVKGLDASNTITDVKLSGDDLVFSFVDAADISISKVVGKDGSSITDISLVDNDLVITTTLDAPDDVITIPMVKGDTVNDISFDEATGDITITTSLDSPNDVVTVPTVNGVDGETINTIALDGNDLVITTSMDAPNDEIRIPTVKGVDGKGINTVTLNESDLVITTNLDAPDDTITIPNVVGNDGVDGATIASAEIDENDDLVITMTDDPATVYTITGVGVGVDTVAVDADTGQLVVTKTDGTEARTTDSIKGRDGNGTGIDSITFTDGSLSVDLIDSEGTVTTVEAGDVSVNSVINARIDENDNASQGVLFFEYEDGTEKEIGNVYGKDGRFVESTRVDGENLTLVMSDSSTIDAGKVTGNDGDAVVSAEVLFSGDLLITYGSGKTENAGSIGSGAGLTVWSEEGKPFVKDRVVIHDGKLYMSKIEDNNDVPPSGNWVPLALGDQLIEVRAPKVVTPVEGNTAFSVRPLLTATPYAPIVSADKLKHRQFQVTLDTDVDFDTPVYDQTEPSDSHELTQDLNVSTTYIWRCRDVSERDYESSWSDVGTFTVPDGIIEQPTISINSEEDINATFNAPQFETSAFVNNFDAKTHSESDWQILDVAQDVVVYENNNDVENLESFIVPFDILETSKNYKIRVRHRADTIESPWSEWLLFITDTTFDYIDKPVVYYDGSLQQVSLYDATFNSSSYRKTEHFLTISANIAVPHELSEWEVYNTDTTTEVERNESSTSLESYTMTNTLENNVNYRIRVRYKNGRFGYSAWSDWLEFSAKQSIVKPTITTTGEVNGFQSGGVFEGSAFSGINETHVSSDWEVRDFFTDTVEWSSMGETVELTNLTFDASIADGDYKIRVRYNGNNVSSDWSEPLDFYYGTPE